MLVVEQKSQSPVEKQEQVPEKDSGEVPEKDSGEVQPDYRRVLTRIRQAQRQAHQLLPELPDSGTD